MSRKLLAFLLFAAAAVLMAIAAFSGAHEVNLFDLSLACFFAAFAVREQPS